MFLDSSARHGLLSGLNQLHRAKQPVGNQVLGMFVRTAQLIVQSPRFAPPVGRVVKLVPYSVAHRQEEACENARRDRAMNAQHVNDICKQVEPTQEDIRCAIDMPPPSDEEPSRLITFEEFINLSVDDLALPVDILACVRYNVVSLSVVIA